jgi:hypothetical protein
MWKMLSRELEVSSGLPFSQLLQGRYVGKLVWEAYQAGLARDPMKVHPRYLRASAAEVKMKAGLLRPAPSAPDSE